MAFSFWTVGLSIYAKFRGLTSTFDAGAGGIVSSFRR